MIPPQYVAPLVASNVVAVAFLLTAIFWPRVARWLFGVLFVGAGLFNGYTVLTNPEGYLTYADLALPPLSAFINGPFSRVITPFILTMSAGQLAVGVLLANKKPLLTLGVVGGVIFLAAIIPLGVGSAQPFSLIAIAALIVMHRRLG